jgi:hypothetical protein
MRHRRHGAQPSRTVQLFLLKVEGARARGLGEIELPRLPRAGEPLQTALGTCVVTSARRLADGVPYAGKIVCRLR